MANYRTHLAGGTVAGIALGSFSHWMADVSLSASLLAGCLCSIGGILPDIDSKTSTSFKRCLAIVAGVSSLLLVSRLRDFPLDVESVVMIGGGIYIAISFFIGGLIRRFTVHRGMCHSIPMAVIAAQIIYLLTSGTVELRLFKAFAIFLGVLVHLTLDEFYSFEVKKKSITKKVRIKKSFGTALKVIDFENMKSTLFFFAIIIFLTEAIMHEPQLTQNNATNSQVDLRGKFAIDHMRKRYPVQYDLSVIEWVAENQLVLEPGTSDNVKWEELESLFVANDSAQNPDNSNSQKKDKDDNQSLSVLEQINWRSRHPKKE